MRRPVWLRRWWWREHRLETILNFLIPTAWGIATYATYDAGGNSSSLWRWAVLPSIGAGIVAQFGLWLYEQRGRAVEEKEAIQVAMIAIAKVVFGVGDSINPLFDPDYRLTLFRTNWSQTRARFSRRFSSSGFNTVRETKLTFKKTVGMTGRALERCQEVLSSQLMPVFNSRPDMVAYHIQQFQLPAETADALDDFMLKVRYIYTFGIIGKSNNCAAVLALDSCKDSPLPDDKKRLFATLATIIIGQHLN